MCAALKSSGNLPQGPRSKPPFFPKNDELSKRLPDQLDIMYIGQPSLVLKRKNDHWEKKLSPELRRIPKYRGRAHKQPNDWCVFQWNRYGLSASALIRCFPLQTRNTAKRIQAFASPKISVRTHRNCRFKVLILLKLEAAAALSLVCQPI